MKNTLLIFGTISSLLLSSCSGSNTEFTSPKETFTANETADLTEGNALLIDVRNPDEVSEQGFDVKHVINIPLDNIESEMDRIPKHKQVILACRSGKRSGKAFDLLKEKGYTNIATMEGGILAWEKAGLPIAAGGNTPKKSCCADPSSPNCNPDGTCKTTDESNDSLKSETSSKKACCSKETKDPK